MSTTPQITAMEDALLENLIDQPPDSRLHGNMPVIFLDVDGVICLNDRGELELSKLALARVCKATGAGIVLSSDWRRRVDLKKRAYDALDRLGIQVLGCTSTTRPCRKKRKKRMAVPKQNHRHVEILEWLEAHADSAGPRRWIAIDDRVLVKEQEGEQMEGHFVRTSCPEGLGDSEADEAIALLNGMQSGLAPTMLVRF